jgi:hypothetical protein
MKFKSAVDSWFYVLALGGPIVVVVSSLFSLSALTISAMVVVGVSVFIALGLPVWLLLSTYYIVEPNRLVVRSGPFKWSIPLSDIKSVKPSRSLLSSPALSLNRLEIQYGSGQSILVSPKDPEGFQNALGAS